MSCAAQTKPSLSALPRALAAAATMSVASVSAHAAELFEFDQYGDEIDNGVIASGSTVFRNGWSPSAADDFRIGDPGERLGLERASILTLEPNDPSTGDISVWDGTLKYAIWLDNGSGMPEVDAIAVGNGVNVVKAGTGRTGIQVLPDPPTGPDLYDQYEYSFELESTVGLSGGSRYWMSIYLGQVEGMTTNTAGILWQQVVTSSIPDGVGFAPVVASNGLTLPPAENFSGGIGWYQDNPSASSLQFRLYGYVPLPETLWLVLAALAAMTGQRRLLGRNAPQQPIS